MLWTGKTQIVLFVWFAFSYCLILLTSIRIGCIRISYPHVRTRRPDLARFLASSRGLVAGSSQRFVLHNPC
jgi:hypothetical protein